MTLKVLILGGYGTFGGRLAQLLKDEAALTLIIAGRSIEKARKFCDGLHGKATAVPATFDRDGAVEAQFRALAPDVVVDASGPFQNYAGSYSVVVAAIALGIDYLDLADGSDFVEGIAQFDAAAKERGVFVLSGVSSFPVLTAAVVRELSKDMMRVERVTGGIAPSPYAGVGLNVIRAIASYGGKQAGSGAGYALIDARRFTIAPPGYLPLHRIRFTLVDVPDLTALPRLWPSLSSVWMGAGPVPAVLHRALSALAYAVRLNLLPSLSPFAGLMHRTINVLQWGEHRGGMFVEVEGGGAGGKKIARSWHLVAEGDDGPMIPSMAAEAIIRHRLGGHRPAAGARAATTELELADYADLFTPRSIVTGVRQSLPAGPRHPLYRRLLGSAWHRLPGPIRELHDFSDDLTVEGRAKVERGSGRAARLIAALFRFPPAAEDVPVQVRFHSDGRREIWQRNFAGQGFSSIQEEGRGRFERLLCERFGPFAFGLALVLQDARLKLIVRGWSFLGIPLPSALAPGGEAYESADDDRFNFNVEISHRFTGLIVRYRGWLKPSG
jgi:Domain of unknown function (DUF4166)/Saccharopine dehydrogenase NADP binding domain